MGSLDNVRFTIEQSSVGETDGVYGALSLGFTLTDGPEDACKALPESATIVWNGGAATKPTKNGGGQNVWCSRAEAHTICGAVETTIVTKELLGSASAAAKDGIDRISVKDGAASFEASLKAGRPKVLSATSKEITVSFDGFDGSIDEASPCVQRTSAKEGCVPLNVTSKAKNQFVAKASSDLKAGPALVLGRVKLQPTCSASAGGKPKTCSAIVSYPMRLAFTIP